MLFRRLSFSNIFKLVALLRFFRGYCRSEMFFALSTWIFRAFHFENGSLCLLVQPVYSRRLLLWKWAFDSTHERFWWKNIALLQNLKLMKRFACKERVPSCPFPTFPTNFKSRFHSCWCKQLLIKFPSRKCYTQMWNTRLSFLYENKEIKKVETRFLVIFI